MRIIEERELCGCDWVSLVRAKVILKDGSEVTWEYLKSNCDIVTVVALDEEKNVYLVKEWRLAWNRDVVELPTGAAPKNASEAELLEQARRELRQEAGVDAKRWIKLGVALLGARHQTKIHMYLALDTFASPLPRDEHELIEVEKMKLDEAIERFTKREETLCYALLPLLLAKLWLERNPNETAKQHQRK